MRRAFAVLAACVALGALAQERPIAPAALQSGHVFAGADVRAMQDDDMANPGMLWVTRGGDLWNAPAGSSGKSCASCHGEAPVSMRGVATRYPALDASTSTLVDLEGRIASCRSRNQNATPLPRESDDLLALATFVAYQSRGMPGNVTIDNGNRAAFERGRAFYEQRHGQMNLACTQCHDQSWGKRLWNETISQGHGNAFPAYRLEWQGLGSLSRRIRACLFGVRAHMPAAGAPELVDVELYLAWRANGLPLEAPGVRR